MTRKEKEVNRVLQLFISKYPTISVPMCRVTGTPSQTNGIFVSGKVYSNGVIHSYILISCYLRVDQIAATTAHELGHHYLNETGQEQSEIAADIFRDNLLK